jgi:galactose mutarotase-like enzyme
MKHISIDTAGKVESWQSSAGTQLIYPAMERADGKRRGGMFACAPNFGKVPRDHIWEKAQSLPQHGLLRVPNIIPAERVEPDSADGSFTRQYCDEFGGTVSFPWRFVASIRYIYSAFRQQLTAQLAITRRRDCTVPELMPLSGGFHPYFATEDEPFEIYGHNVRVMQSAEDFTSGHSVRNPGYTLQLKRGRHVIEILPVSGFDRFVVWSDDNSKYICIEPTFGTHDTICLKPGQTHSTLCLFTYHYLHR